MYIIQRFCNTYIYNSEYFGWLQHFPAGRRELARVGSNLREGKTCLPPSFLTKSDFFFFPRNKIHIFVVY